eukprot:Nk52_evm4s294 gene=Nk52_evmTU4s294
MSLKSGKSSTPLPLITALLFSLAYTLATSLLVGGVEVDKLNETNWKRCELSVEVPANVSQVFKDEYHIECYWHEVPLDWQTSSEGNNADKIPMYLQRVYPKKMRSVTDARGGLLFANPGGPGEGENVFQSESFIKSFMTLTGNKFVIYVQKLRGVIGKGAIGCKKGKDVVTYQSGVNSGNDEKKCWAEIMKEHGKDLEFYGYEQGAYDLKHHLQMIKTTMKSPVTVYGCSCGTRFLQVYMNMFGDDDNVFDQIVLDGLISPGYYSFSRMYDEGWNLYTAMTMSQCASNTKCWSRFRGLRYCVGKNEGQICSGRGSPSSTRRGNWAPVLSVKDLYEHLIRRMHQMETESICLQRLMTMSEVTKGLPELSLNSKNVTMALKYAAAKMAGDDGRALIPLMVRQMYDCEYRDGKEADTAVKELLHLVAKMLTNDLYYSNVQSPITYNYFLGSYIVSNYFEDPSTIVQEYKNTTFEMYNQFNTGVYSRIGEWTDVHYRIEMFNDPNYVHKPVKRSLSALRNGTSKPILVLNGDMDPQTPLSLSRDHFGGWMRGPEEKQVSIVIPYAQHTMWTGHTDYRPEYKCGVQLVASFIFNRGRIASEDMSCVRQASSIDFQMKKPYTKNAFKTYYGE